MRRIRGKLLSEAMDPNASNRLRCIWIIGGLGVAILFMGFVSLRVGAVSISTGELWELLWKKGSHSSQAIILWQIRFPRSVLALLGGASLAVAGAAMQGIFRNPLADPSLIGIAAGGAMGTVVVIGLEFTFLKGVAVFLGPWIRPVFAFVFAMGVTAFIYRFARIGGCIRVTHLLLTGIAVNAFIGAFIGFLNYYFEPEQLQEYVFWTLGSLAKASWKQIAGAASFMVVPLVILPFFARALNALSLGEKEAYHLGVSPKFVQMAVISLSAAMVGSCVAVCGMICFVGLIVPHALRLMIGPDHRLLIPASALGGALLLLCADLLARSVIAPGELPIGVLTALMGAPFFLMLLWQRNRDLFL